MDTKKGAEKMKYCLVKTDYAVWKLVKKQKHRLFKALLIFIIVKLRGC